MISPASVSPGISTFRRTLPSLTGLRWVAALVVFFYHLRNLGYFGGQEQQWLSAVVGGGFSAVSLFFVLSGFVLAWSDRGDVVFARSWWNRIVRIYPLHLIGVSLALVVAATVYPGIRTGSDAGLTANVFLLNSWRAEWWQAGNPVSWSLSCEMFFYFLAPFLIRALHRGSARTVAIVAVASLVVIWVVPFAVALAAPSVSAYSNPLARLPEFVLGVATGVLMSSHRWRGPRLTFAVPVIVIGYVVSTADPQNPLSAAGFTAAGSALLIAGLARRDIEGRSSWLATPGMVFLGEVSFAFYVVHLLVLQAVQGLFSGLHAALPVTAVSGAFVALFTAVALGVILHRAIERPFVRALRPVSRPRAARVRTPAHVRL